MAKQHVVWTMGGPRYYEGEYVPQEGDVKRLGFVWHWYQNGKWQVMPRAARKRLKEVMGKKWLGGEH